MDAKCKLEGCPNPVTGRQTYCTDRVQLYLRSSEGEVVFEASLAWP
jgi:hypothetical protein